MALEWWLELGGIEIANHTRLAAYLETVGSPMQTVGGVCGCPTLTPEVLEHEPYTTPAEDEAPWYDPDVPESADFAGLMVTSVDGLDDHPRRRSTTGAVAGGAALGPAQTTARTITVTAVLLGATCCAVEYGLHWLAQALEGCTGSACSGDCLVLFNCCPGEAPEDPEEFATAHRRTLRRVALVSGPTPISRVGDGCAAGECQSGADIITVEFVLVAATPWLWTDPMPLLEVPPPVDDSEECVTWCVHSPGSGPLCLELGDACAGGLAVEFTDGGPECETVWEDDESTTAPCAGPCRLAACPDPTTACADPRCVPPAPPVPSLPESCYCVPLAVERDCYELDLSHRPAASVDVPVITIRAGGQELRNLTITFYEKSETHDDLDCERIAGLERCNPHSVYHVQYIPAGGAITLDGQIGRAIVECGGECETSGDVYGRDGLPPTWRPLDCATYCVCLETDVANPPGPDAMVTISVSGRGY